MTKYDLLAPTISFFVFSGGGKSATRATITTALLIWVLAVICGLPALAGTHIAVRDKNMIILLFFF
jgi:bombesin receptor subtype-3